MDRQLAPPLRLEPVSVSTPLSSSKAHTALSHYVSTLAPGTSRTQLERLVDSLGVDLGLIAPDEGHRREEQRRIAKSERRAERKRAREQAEREGMEDLVEGLQADQGDEVEQGAVGFEGEDGMEDRGDIEYEDEEGRDSEQDEPDREDEGQEKMDVDVDVDSEWFVLHSRLELLQLIYRCDLPLHLPARHTTI